MGDFDQIEYINEYNKSHYDNISIRVPKGTKQEWKSEAQRRGLSLAELITRAIDAFCNPKPKS